MTNISPENASDKTIAQYFRILGQPVRIQILLLLEKQDACVCHLEAFLGIRQALISQHLMLMREAGIVTFYREGRNIYYQLAHRDVLTVIQQVAGILNFAPSQNDIAAQPPAFPCPCPHCNPEGDPGFDCSHLSAIAGEGEK